MNPPAEEGEKGHERRREGGHEDGRPRVVIHGVQPMPFIQTAQALRSPNLRPILPVAGTPLLGALPIAPGESSGLLLCVIALCRTNRPKSEGLRC